MTETITVSGEQHPFTGQNLVELLAERGIAAERRGIAVALNGAVVPRGDWPGTRLSPGDRVEIAEARAGG